VALDHLKLFTIQDLKFHIFELHNYI